jgi:glycerol-3-phosphate dehydrogenase (NAD(P)+)
MEIAVLGAGNWGTVLADLAGRNGHAVKLWTRDAAVRDELNAHRTNARAVPGLAVADAVRAVTDLGEALRGAELVIAVLPAQALREVCRAAGELLAPEQYVIHASKGLEVGTHRRMSEVLQEETCVRQLGVLCGPNIAAEIAAGRPAGTVIASRFRRVVDAGRRALSSPRLRVFHGDDVVGVELCGALKNVVAIAAGMATALDLGENAKALLVTRGLSEIAALATALGARADTLRGLAGVGDLLVTCASPHSRNHRVGAALARGATLPDALAALGMVAEGVPTARTTHELIARHGVDAPILERVYRVLYEGLTPAAGLRELLELPAGRDVVGAE